MDAAPEIRKEMLDQILAMATKMASDLEEMNAQLRSMVGPSSPSSTSDLTSDTADANLGFQSGATELPYTCAPFVSTNDDLVALHIDSVLVVHSAPTSPIPSPTSAPPHGADPVSTDGDLFDADDKDVDRLSRLPDSLLRDIIARLPLKEAGRTAVLSRRWSPIWPRHRRAAQLGVFCLDPDRLYGFGSRLSDGLLEQIRLQQEGHARPLLANYDPGAGSVAARAWRPPWLRSACSTPSWRCYSPSREPAAEFLLIRPYDPGAGSVGGDCVGVYLDIKEAEHARVKTSAMGLLRRNTRTWPADLRTGVGTLLEAVLGPGAEDEPCSTRVRPSLLLPLSGARAARLPLLLLPAACAVRRAQLTLRHDARRHSIHACSIFPCQDRPVAHITTFLLLHLAQIVEVARAPVLVAPCRPHEEIFYWLVDKQELSRITPDASTESSSAKHTRYSILCLYQRVGNKLTITCEISASSENMVLLRPAASTSDACNVFKVMPVFLFLPPSSCYFAWNLHSVPGSSSLVWPSFHYKRDDKFLKFPWPPPTQGECKDGDINLCSIHWMSLACSNGVKLLVPQPWPPPVSDMIASSQEEIQPQIWLVMSNRTGVTVQLKALQCCSIFVGCFCTVHWRFDIVMISDELGAFIVLSNYLVGTQVCSLCQTKSAVFQVMVPGWCNVQLQQQQKCTDGQRVIPWAACDDLQTIGMLHSHLLDMFKAFSNAPNVGNLKVRWPTSGSLAPRPPWLLHSEVVHGLFTDWQEQPWPLPNYRMMLLPLYVNCLLSRLASRLMAVVLPPVWIFSQRHIMHCILLAEITELLLPWGAIWLSKCYEWGVIFSWTSPTYSKGLVHIPAVTMLQSWWPFGHNDDNLMDYQLGCHVLKLPKQHTLHLAIMESRKWSVLNWQTSRKSMEGICIPCSCSCTRFQCLYLHPGCINVSTHTAAWSFHFHRLRNNTKAEIMGSWWVSSEVSSHTV